MILIKNAHIITMAANAADFSDGYIIIEGKVIKAVGDMAEYPAALEVEAGRVVDAGGGCVSPGFVDAHCHLGMWEDGLGFEGDDGNEDTDPATPQLRAIDAVNPRDRAFSEAWRSGVTSVVTGPGSANPIGGQMLAMKTFGSRIDDMIIKQPLAVKIAFGENPKTVYHGKNQTPVTRMGTAAVIREQLFKAREYKERMEEYKKTPGEKDKPEFDFKSEALLPVLEREIPVHAHAHRADDIFTALRVAREFDIKLVLIHCTEGHLIADELAAEGAPLLIGPSLSERSKAELRNLTFTTPGILAKRGIPVAIITDHPVVPINYLPLCGLLAVKSGMDRAEALRAVTSNAAEAVGIAGRVGSIEAGKDADILIFDRDVHPLDFDARIKYVIGDGKILE